MSSPSQPSIGIKQLIQSQGKKFWTVFAVRNGGGIVQPMHAPGGMVSTHVTALGTYESVVAHFKEAYPGCDIHVSPAGCMPFIEIDTP